MVMTFIPTFSDTYLAQRKKIELHLGWNELFRGFGIPFLSI